MANYVQKHAVWLCGHCVVNFCYQFDPSHLAGPFLCSVLSEYVWHVE